MTEYVYANQYFVEVEGSTATVILGPFAGPYTVAELTEDPLEVNDTVNVEGDSLDYVGYSTDGSMLLTNGFGFYLYTNTEYEVGNQLVVTEATYPYCLLAGSMVATPSGERLVQDIRPGDEVLTADGQTVTVRWVGRQSLITVFAGEAGIPVMIRAGALGDNTPTTDLCVSGDHAIAIDRYLVCAQALINGTTITRMPNPPAQLDYYHLELDTHRIILANGTPVESFVDDVTRAGFDNYSEWVDLGLDPLPAQALDLPRIKSARQLHTSFANALVGGLHSHVCCPTTDTEAESFR
jgi:hypothetical protein